MSEFKAVPIDEGSIPDLNLVLPTIYSLSCVAERPKIASMHSGHAIGVIGQLLHRVIEAQLTFKNDSTCKDMGVTVDADGQLGVAVTNTTFGDSGLYAGTVFLLRGLQDMSIAEIHVRLSAKIAGGLKQHLTGLPAALLAEGCFALGSWYQTMSGTWALASDFVGQGLLTRVIDQHGVARFCYGPAAGSVFGIEREAYGTGTHPLDVLVPSGRGYPNRPKKGPDGAVAGTMAEQAPVPSAAFALQDDPYSEAEEAQTLLMQSPADDSEASRKLGDASCIEPVETGKCGGDCGSCPNGGSEVQNFGQAPE